MAKFFGVSNHSPDQVITFLQKKKVVKDGSKIAIMSFGTRMKEGRVVKGKIVFVISIADFYHNLKVLRAQSDDTMIFLFASPLRIVELKGVVPLDFQPNKEYQGMAYCLTTLNAEKFKNSLSHKAPEDIRRNIDRYIASLVESVKQGSLLNPLMTFIYMLPRSSHQTPVKESVAEGIYKGWSSDKIFENIASKGLQLSSKAADVLEDILTNTIASSYTKAFAKYRTAKKKGAVNLKSLCKDTSTSDYEIRYLLSVLESMKKRSSNRGKNLSELTHKQPVNHSDVKKKTEIIKTKAMREAVTAGISRVVSNKKSELRRF